MNFSKPTEINSVGKVYVNNKTLKQSINSIENKCFEKYPNVNVHNIKQN